MNAALLFPPSVSLIDEVAARLLEHGPDCADALVVFPGKRPGHFLRKKLGERIGSAYLPPRILSIDALIDWLYGEIHGGGDPLIGEPDGIAILFEIHRASAGRIGGDQFASLDEFLPLGSKIFSELEELKSGLVPVESVRALDGLKLPFSHLGSLSEFYERFYSALQQRGLSSRASRAAAVAGSCTPDTFSPFRSVTLAGFYSCSRAELTVCRSMLAHPAGAMLLHQGPGIETLLAGLGVAAARSDGPHRKTAYEFIASPDTHGEIFAVTSLVGALERSGQADEETVIVLPDAEALFPLLHETLAGMDESRYNVSLGYPLERTPAFAFLSAIMDAVAGMHKGMFHAREYFALVLHPYVKNIRFRAVAPEVTRVLFHTLEEEWGSDPARNYFTLEELESSDAVGEVLNRLEAAQELFPDGGITVGQLREHLEEVHAGILRPFLNIESVGDFCLKAVDVLGFVAGKGTASRHIWFSRFSASLTESLEGLASSLLANESFRDIAGYVNFIRTCLAGARVPFEGTPLHGLQALGLLETRNLPFKRVVILDANEDVLPGSPGMDMLLPRQIREQLGLETAHDRERETGYYLHVLTRGAEQVTFINVSAPGKERSRYVEETLWMLQRPAGEFDPRKRTSSVQYRVSLANRLPGPVKKSPLAAARLAEMTFSASMLDTYMTCGLKFYYSRVAGLRERADAAEGPDPMDIGTFVHDVLKEYFSKFKSNPLRASGFKRSELDATVAARFSAAFGDEPAGMKTLLRQQVARHLWEFIEQYQIPVVNNHKKVSIARLEKEFGCTRNGREFIGKADRIEIRDTTHVILDYKTGANAGYYKVDLQKLDPPMRETWPDAIGSFQLPLYALMYSAAFGVEIERVRPVYLMLGRNRIDESCEVPLFPPGEGTKEQYDTLGDVVDSLAAEIADPTLRFNPPDDPRSACTNCSFTAVCGTQWVVGKR